jgi:2-keto-4-pentenoate hydratase/2-oxohepta-3-ene-1,7-dioic acid hydratase in catechol pathway
MKWLRFSYQDSPHFGALEADKVRLYSGNMFDQPIATDVTVALADIHDDQYLAPCLPSKMFALWNNFASAAAKNGWATPSEPLYFLKANNTFSAHRAPVQKPKSFAGRILYEAELGIVIGKSGKNISFENAKQHIFGYTCVNDVTALDLLRADASFEQWTRAKGFDGFAPFGPYIETDVDLSTLHVKAIMNGRERQNYPVADMFFSPEKLVSLLSRDVTLLAGDVISCGTSVGAGPWAAGATVEVVIDGIGNLSNALQA